MTFNAYDECHFPECHYADLGLAECRYAKCHFAECRGAHQWCIYFMSVVISRKNMFISVRTIFH